MNNFVLFLAFTSGIVYLFIGEKVNKWSGTFMSLNVNDPLVRLMWPIMIWIPIYWHFQDKRDEKHLERIKQELKNITCPKCQCFPCDCTTRQTKYRTKQELPKNFLVDLVDAYNKHLRSKSTYKSVAVGRG